MGSDRFSGVFGRSAWAVEGLNFVIGLRSQVHRHVHRTRDCRARVRRARNPALVARHFGEAAVFNQTFSIDVPELLLSITCGKRISTQDT